MPSLGADVASALAGPAAAEAVGETTAGATVVVPGEAAGEGAGEAAGEAAGEGAGEAAGEAAGAALEGGLAQPAIPDQAEQMGYPREVVPRAELVDTVSSGEGTELPHWADPPTGEVPRALAEQHSEDDAMQAWRLLGSRGLHWRDDVNDWSNAPGVEDLVDENDEPVTPPPPVRGGRFSFDEEFERLERARTERAGSLSDSTSPGAPELVRVAMQPRPCSKCRPTKPSFPAPPALTILVGSPACGCPSPCGGGRYH